MNRQEIYNSKAWKQIRYGYALYRNCKCERCQRAVYVTGINDYLPKEKRLRYIVHHKRYINELNKNDDEVVYDWDNLELLCIDCHNDEHFGIKSTKKGLKFDEYGNLVEKSNKRMYL